MLQRQAHDRDHLNRAGRDGLVVIKTDCSTKNDVGPLSRAFFSVTFQRDTSQHYSTRSYTFSQPKQIIGRHNLGTGHYPFTTVHILPSIHERRFPRPPWQGGRDVFTIPPNRDDRQPLLEQTRTSP
ncbi:uncharacterized protein PV07_02570 [Cladophialophora immunda]|uniref:Uncharacterized protein n=1 Tax=Cladophialophora immunda TaxID=569365 RepID=A0A0D2CIA8_9EURO|nr:uncharacterized protein PV07_02570 [Cladophialophora immunda]KIW30878.1 hypothetical protein PV07_02570 [Cladophialophora immunda]